ncbi:hypothetical protein MRX96_059010 [Rhipicephalus microplus]
MSDRPSEGFKHCISALNLYFVDKQGSIYTLYRLEVRYSTICRIILCKKSSTATTAFLHLLHTPLLYKLCAGKNAQSHCHRKGDYIPKFDLSDTTRGTGLSNLAKARSSAAPTCWGRAASYGWLSKDPATGKPLRNLIERTCSSAQVFYAAVRELARSRLEGGAQAQRIWMVGWYPVGLDGRPFKLDPLGRPSRPTGACCTWRALSRPGFAVHAVVGLPASSCPAGISSRTVPICDVIVTKNPCMHPGDLRKLTAVNVPQLHHVRDCIVFPVKGDRPHPEEMAGSDLDGDEDSVLWYADLIFKTNCSPMHYYSDPPREQKTPIQVQDMIDLFCQYIKGDKIGLIANAHLVWADLLDAGINSRRCRNQARKCSVNLDFANCGDLKGLAKLPEATHVPGLHGEAGRQEHVLLAKGPGPAVQELHEG